MILTRDIINKNLKFHEYIVNIDGDNQTVTYDISDLYTLIDCYKNLLVANGASTSCSAIIGDRVGLSQLAFTFACAELGIAITIVDPPSNTISNNGTKVFNKLLNTKLNQLLPITFLLVKNDRSFARPKLDVLKSVALKYIVANDYNLDNTPNNIIKAKPDSIFLKCTSSGSTGESKVISHTHQFMYELIHRNSFMYDGKMGIMSNLNHGSSPATYFLPGLVSEKVTDIYNILIEQDEVKKASLPVLDHMMFPYTTLIDSFLENKNNFTNTTLYTLSYIKSDWVKKVEDKKIKDIVSIFGTSETSGPIFLNKVSYKDFTPNTYKKVDDLYGISIESDNLLVTMPIYNYTTETGDSFQSLGDNYIYLGRNNLVRVNDVEINLARYDKLVKNFGNCDLIVDVINNALYLAIWEENSNKDIVDNINNQLRSISNNLHFISKFDYLKMQDFLTGVKVDKQLLRDYFRTR